MKYKKKKKIIFKNKKKKKKNHGSLYCYLFNVLYDFIWPFYIFTIPQLHITLLKHLFDTCLYINSFKTFNLNVVKLFTSPLSPLPNFNVFLLT